MIVCYILARRGHVDSQPVRVSSPLTPHMQAAARHPVAWASWLVRAMLHSFGYSARASSDGRMLQLSMRPGFDRSIAGYTYHVLHPRGVASYFGLELLGWLINWLGDPDLND
jgi:hypothetical protein